MKNFFKKHLVVFFNVVLIGICTYLIVHSEKIQEKICYDKFWEKKVNTLNSRLKQDDIRIKNLELDLEKHITLGSYHKKDAKIKAQDKDVDENEIYSKIQRDHIKKIQEIKKQISDLKQDEYQIKKELYVAKNKVNKPTH